MRVRPIARALRLGCSAVRQTPTGSLLAVGDRRVYRKEDGGNRFELVQNIERGTRPLHRGLCVSADGAVYWGEYFGNTERESVHIFGSDDDGRSFHRAYSFAAGTIRHVHGIQEDPEDLALWIMTGDEGAEPGLYRASSNLADIELVGGGSQQWRCLSLLFAPEYIYWGTDSPYEQNHLIRFDRQTGRTERIQEVGGPVYYSGRNEAGMMFFATTVEPGPAASSRAQIWVSGDGDRFVLLADYPKDAWPAKLFQFGVLQFPHGMMPGSQLVVSATGLMHADNLMMVGTVTDC